MKQTIQTEMRVSGISIEDGMESVELSGPFTRWRAGQGEGSVLEAEFTAPPGTFRVNDLVRVTIDPVAMERDA